MINIILLILIINQIFHIVVKPLSTTLNCGLWGFFGNINKFDLNKFNILGINNEDRGGDAIGVATPESIIHNISHLKYTDFIAANKLKYPSKKINYIAGHVRKASDNKTRNLEEYAQPMINWNDDFTEINHIISHNGTLLEYNKLFDLYLKDIGITKFSYLNINTGNITINNTNDTYILFQALIYKKYELLKNYAGSAAFTYYNVKTKELCLYAGSSKAIYTDSITNERPLYYLQENDYIWYSSIKKGLNIIGNKNNVSIVKPNTLMFFKNGLLINEISIDRSNSGQTIYKTNALKPVYKNSFPAIKNIYKNHNNTLPRSNSSVVLPSTINIFKEKIIDTNFYIKYINSRYYYKERLINGIYHITENGLVKSTPDYFSKYDTSITNIYYFINGVMLENHFSYNKTCKMIKKFHYKMGTLNYFTLLCKYSIYPISNIYSDDYTCRITFYKYVKNNTLDGSFKFNGKILALFSSKEYFFISGILDSITDLRWENKADHSANKKNIIPISNKINNRFCSVCGIMLTDLENNLCDFCAEVELEKIKSIKNKTLENSENNIPWYENTNNFTDIDNIDISQINNNIDENEIKAELNSIDIAVSELRYKLLGESNPFFKKTTDFCEEIQDALINLENWSWENNNI